MSDNLDTLLSGSVPENIHKWLKLFCPKWFCQKGECPAWCSNINQVCDTWLYTHQAVYFNFIIIFYFVTIQPAIIYFTSKMMASKIKDIKF